jgi:hypothetical protein
LPRAALPSDLIRPELEAPTQSQAKASQVDIDTNAEFSPVTDVSNG